MEIIENPTAGQLAQIQAVLEKDKDAALRDIYGQFISQYIAAKENGAIVGVAAIREQLKSAELLKLYVVPSHRKKGVGKLLFDRTMAILAAKGCGELDIEILGDSGAFWAKVKSKLKIDEFPDNKFTVNISLKS